MITVVESKVESVLEILFGKLYESLNLSILNSEDQDFATTIHYYFSLVCRISMEDL